MTVYYFDPSAWIKRHFHETGSQAVGELFRTVETAVCCRLGLIEMMAAVARKSRADAIDLPGTQQLLGNVREDFDEFEVLPVDEALMESATELAVRHCLRTMDAIHLAAALSYKSGEAEVIVVSSDRELIAAADREGLATVNPVPV